MRKLLGKLFKPTPPPPPKRFPPVPKWQPPFQPPHDAVIERMHYYLGGKRDFAVFANGTCVVVPNGLPEEEARKTALKILSDIFRHHPDMNPTAMDDGNTLVRYNHPAFNVVITAFARAHWDEIDAHHLDALAAHEVLIDAQGRRNVFNDQGKMALFGRCFMFVDAQAPAIIRLERAKTPPEQ